MVWSTALAFAGHRQTVLASLTLRDRMRTRPFGPSGAPVSVIGQGTWRLRDARAAEPSIGEGVHLGLTHIDTAELYEENSGSETALGELLSQSTSGGGALRDKVFLASKVKPGNASKRGTKSACKDSLVRLQTDHLDLYYLHWPGPHPVADTMATMADLVDAGWVKHIGVSNFDVDGLDEVKSALGSRKLAANQVYYHLEDRGCESEVLPWCKANQVALVAYSPFGAGNWVKDRKRLAALDAVARQVGKTPRQVALAFLTRDKSVFAIPKAEKPQHVVDNAGGDFDLPNDAIAALDASFPVEPGLRTI